MLTHHHIFTFHRYIYLVMKHNFRNVHFNGITMPLSKDMIVFKEIKKQTNFLVMRHKLLNKIICTSS